MAFLAVGVSHEYKMTGKIAAIAYTDRTSTFCYVAINDNSSARGNYFHEVKREQMCWFAESCFAGGHSVIAYGDASVLGANKISTIEIESPQTKWWTMV